MSAATPVPVFLDHPGEMAARIRDFDWGATGLGALPDWPQSLCVMVATLLRAPLPMTLQWGRSGWLIYNDAFAAFAGPRHPGLLGRCLADSWPELKAFRSQALHSVLDGQSLSYRDKHLVVCIDGRATDVWLDIDYSPVVDAAGKTVGALAVVRDGTERVRALQRLLIAQEAGRVGVFEWYPEGDRIEASAAFRDVLGVDCAATLTMADLAGLLGAGADAPLPGAGLAPGESLPYREYALPAGTGADAGERWVALRGRWRATEDDAPCFTGILADISDRKRAELALERSEEQRRRVIAQMDIHQIRHHNVRLLVDSLNTGHGRGGRRAGGLAMLAEMLGKSASQVSRFASERPSTPIGGRIAREIEQAFGKEHGWLDHVQGLAD